MTTADDIRAHVRADARERLRNALLDATHAIAVADGWGAVRMAAVAAAVGVSRQTLYVEFGSKEALGQAVVLRETDRFLLGVTDALGRRPGSLGGAIAEAVTYTLRSTAANPLLQTVLTSARSGGDETLLPLLTSRSEPLLHRSSDVLCAWMADHFPDLDPTMVADVVDSVVRLVVSHAVLPVEPPDVVGARIGRLAEAGLGVPSR